MDYTCDYNSNYSRLDSWLKVKEPLWAHCSHFCLRLFTVLKVALIHMQGEKGEKTVRSPKVFLAYLCLELRDKNSQLNIYYVFYVILWIQNGLLRAANEDEK